MVNRSRNRSLLPQKNLAGSDEVDEVAEAVAVFGEGGGDFVDLATVEGLETAPGGVGEHFLGKATGKIRLAFQEHLLEGDDVGELIAVGQLSGRINLRPTISAVMGAPAADRIKVFESESHRVNLAMATGAGLVFAVQLELFANGLGAAQVGRERLDIRRRR